MRRRRRRRRKGGGTEEEGDEEEEVQGGGDLGTQACSALGRWNPYRKPASAKVSTSSTRTLSSPSTCPELCAVSPAAIRALS
eukprot:3467969-Rhodomonas_salina.1